VSTPEYHAGNSAKERRGELTFLDAEIPRRVGGIQSPQLLNEVLGDGSVLVGESQSSFVERRRRSMFVDDGAD